MRRAVWFTLGSLIVVAVLFLFVLPARTYLAGRRSLDRTVAEIKVFDRENASLTRQIQLLQTNADIERLARQRYGLVLPGESAYAILPPQSAPAQTAQPAVKGHRN